MSSMMLSSMTYKGQVTIPVSLRKKLKLEEGDKVKFVEKNGTVILIPFKKRKLMDIFNLFPKSKISLTIEEMNEAIESGHDENWR